MKRHVSQLSQTEQLIVTAGQIEFELFKKIDEANELRTRHPWAVEAIARLESEINVLQSKYSTFNALR